MKRTVVAATVIGLALSGAGLASAKPGNGAQKAGLAEASGLTPLGCSAADDAGKQTALGFEVLNAPGKPGSPRKVVGEVSVKAAEPGTYDVLLATPSSSCGDKVGTLTVNEQGHGNAGISAPTAEAGTYYVVLAQPVLDASIPVSAQRYASAPVTLR
jgi:hypothetical protein